MIHSCEAKSSLTRLVGSRTFCEPSSEFYGLAFLKDGKALRPFDIDVSSFI